MTRADAARGCEASRRKQLGSLIVKKGRLGSRGGDHSKLSQSCIFTDVFKLENSCLPHTTQYEGSEKEESAVPVGVFVCFVF